jgi:hypothetical protein
MTASATFKSKTRVAQFFVQAVRWWSRLRLAVEKLSFCHPQRSLRSEEPAFSLELCEKQIASLGMTTNFGLSAAVQWCDPQIGECLHRLFRLLRANSGLFLF